MNILLLSSAYNSLTQHAQVELKALGHRVGVGVATTGEAMREAVRQFPAELVLCPMLAQVIPRDIWEKHTCIILHAGTPVTGAAIRSTGQSSTKRRIAH
ncbi:MAG: hypothetical protein AB1648_16235 [Pseudomonadota bacterium]